MPWPGQDGVVVKACEASYSVDIGPVVLAMLVKRGFVLDHETDDEVEVARGISLFLKEFAEPDEA